MWSKAQARLISLFCWAIAVAVVVLTQIAARSTFAGTEEAVNYHNQGFQLVKAGNYREAFQKFSMAIAEDSTMSSSYACRGLCYEALGSNDLALKDFNIALRLDPKDTIALHNRGVYFIHRKQFQKAIPDLSKSLVLGDVDPPGTYAARGLAYAETKQYELALKDLNQALKLRQQQPVAYYGRAVAFWGLKQYPKVFADLDYALRYEPSLSKTGNVIGALSAIALKQYDKAISYLNSAIRQDPQNKDLHLMRCEAYATRKDYQPAISDLSEIIRSHPQVQELFKRRAQLCLLAKNYGQAATDCDKYAELAEGDREVYTIGLLVNSFLGQWQKSAQYAGKLFSHPDWTTQVFTEMVPVAYVAYRSSDQQSTAQKLIDEALAKADQTKWPFPVIQYLHHDLSANQLLEKASDAEKMTDARAWIGFESTLGGDGTAVNEQLQWIKEQGKKDQISYELATRELKPRQQEKTTTETTQPVKQPSTQ